MYISTFGYFSFSLCDVIFILSKAHTFRVQANIYQARADIDRVVNGGMKKLHKRS